jgi:hypothetical protein
MVKESQMLDLDFAAPLHMLFFSPFGEASFLCTKVVEEYSYSYVRRRSKELHIVFFSSLSSLIYLARTQ